MAEIDKSGDLTEAFRKLREDTKLSEVEKDAIAKFTDMFITCSLNPDTVHADKDVGKRIVKIAQDVNCHNCTNPCKKYEGKCKYGFPRYPLKETVVIDKNEFVNVPEVQDSKQDKNASFGC